MAKQDTDHVDYVHKSVNEDIESGIEEETLKFYRDNSYILIVKHENCPF